MKANIFHFPKSYYLKDKKHIKGNNKKLYTYITAQVMVN